MSKKKDNQKDEKIDLEAKIKEAEAADKAEQEELSEVDQLKAELEKMTETAKRTMADMQNMKRRQEEESKVMFVMANMSLIRALLPAVDSLEKALKHRPDAEKEWCDGIEMSVKQLQSALDQAGLKVIATEGQEFNPDLHEALLQGPGEKNIILEELEKGYMLGERVLRHSKVKVGTGE